MQYLSTLSFIAFIILTQNAFADNGIDFEKLADAIHISENGKLLVGEAYGIHTVRYETQKDAREICIRTCKHKYQDWRKQSSPGEFLEYLSRKYCPINSKIWLKNVKYFYDSL